MAAFVFPVGMSSALAHGGSTPDDITGYSASGSGDGYGSGTASNASSATTTTALRAVAAAATSPAQSGAVQAIDIKDFAFPAETTVKVGTTVTWTNRDSAAHTVTSGPRSKPDGKFDAKLAQNQTFSFTFTTAGTFEYFCKPHANMNAKIIVVNGDQGAAAPANAAAPPQAAPVTDANLLGVDKVLAKSQPISEADRDFVRKVKTAGLWEMPAGQLAQESNNPKIREVGAKLMAEHADLDKKVTQVAADLEITLPASPTAQQQGFLDEFQRTSGDQFNRVWVARLRAAHGSVFITIAKIRATTQNDEIRALAEAANTIVLRHINYLESTGLVAYGDLPDPTKATTSASLDATLSSAFGGSEARTETLLAVGIISVMLLGVLGYLYRATS